MFPPKTPPMNLKNEAPDHEYDKMLQPQLHSLVHQQLSREGKAVFLPVLGVVDSGSDT